MVPLPEQLLTMSREKFQSGSSHRFTISSTGLRNKVYIICLLWIWYRAQPKVKLNPQLRVVLQIALKEKKTPFFKTFPTPTLPKRY